jgi:guanylate kinase
MQTPGNLIVVAAPSGAGKSSLVKALLELDSRLGVSVSHTTRAPRGQELDGREYWFITEPEFRAMAGRDEFFEWAEVHGHLYGTSRLGLEQRLMHGDDVILEIDWQGALQIKQLFPDAVLIFILPPSWNELRQRLQRRGEDHPEVIALRMKNALGEMSHWPEYTYRLLSSSREEDYARFKSLIVAERMRVSRL